MNRKQLEEALMEAKFDNISLTCRLTTSENTAKDLDEYVNELKAERENLFKTIKGLENAIVDKNMLILQLRDEIRGSSEDNVNLEAKLDDALYKISMLEGELNER